MSEERKDGIANDNKIIAMLQLKAALAERESLTSELQ